MNPFQKLQRFADRLGERFERWAFRGLPFCCDDYDVACTPVDKHEVIMRTPSTVDPFEAAYRYTSRNPDRIECPGDEILRGLATKELDISHPARIHITRCSPCLQEFRAFEEALGVRHPHNEHTFVERSQ